MIDFLTAKSSKNSKPLTNVFYVKETGNKYKISNDDLELTGLKGILSTGEYKEILIINEVSGLGLLARKASINEKNQIIWNDNTSSLMKFMFTPYMGDVSSGVTPLMKYGDADKIANIFRGCQLGKIPIGWKPTEKDIDFYYKTIDFFYTLSVSLP